jgi:hypothetical protein
MIKLSTLSALAREFSILEADRESIEFRQASWARRAVVACGSSAAFVAWCKSDLNLTEARAIKLDALAPLFAVVSDEETWRKLGGSSAVRRLVPLAKRDRVVVVEESKVSGAAVSTIIRQRGLDGLPPIVKVAKPDIEPLTSSVKLSQAHRDAATLAEFISAHSSKLGRLPGAVADLLAIYAPTQRRKAA